MTAADDQDCVFCAISASAAPAEIVYEDDHTVAFLDIAPLTRGHTLVIPRRHVVDLWDSEPADAARVMRTAHTVAATMRERLDPDGLNVLQATRPVAFQTVFHLHLHVIPRWHDDGIEVPDWSKEQAEPDDLAAVADLLRQ